MNKEIIVFDSSNWINLIKTDYTHKVITYLQDQYYILLTSEVLLELMNVCEDERIKRINYLSKCSNVKCLHYKTPNMAGSIIDLRSYEYSYYLNNNNNSINEYIRSKISNFNINYLQDFLYIPQSIISEIIDGFIVDTISTSIPSWIYYDDPKQFRDKKARNVPTYSKSINSFESHMNSIDKKFRDKADGKKNEITIKSQASKFVKSIQFPGKIKSKNVFELITELSGYPIELFNTESTIEDLILKFEYLSKLMYFHENTRFPINELVNIDERLIHSWVIEREFKREYERIKTDDFRNNAEASSIIDKYLAAYSHYFKIFVDKRTYIILNRVKARFKNNEIEMKYQRNTDFDHLCYGIKYP